MIDFIVFIFSYLIAFKCYSFLKNSKSIIYKFTLSYIVIAFISLIVLGYFSNDINLMIHEKSEDEIGNKLNIFGIILFEFIFFWKVLGWGPFWIYIIKKSETPLLTWLLTWFFGNIVFAIFIVLLSIYCDNDFIQVVFKKDELRLIELKPIDILIREVLFFWEMLVYTIIYMLMTYYIIKPIFLAANKFFLKNKLE